MCVIIQSSSSECVQLLVNQLHSRAESRAPSRGSIAARSDKAKDLNLASERRSRADRDFVNRFRAAFRNLIIDSMLLPAFGSFFLSFCALRAFFFLFIFVLPPPRVGSCRRDDERRRVLCSISGSECSLCCSLCACVYCLCTVNKIIDLLLRLVDAQASRSPSPA